MNDFHEVTPTLENWRSVILFGRNVVSYKFALGKALLDLGGRTDDLGPPRGVGSAFCSAPCRSPQAGRQAGSLPIQPIPRCVPPLQRRRSRGGRVGRQHRLGFVNVIDAFHVVNQGEVPVRFFLDERTSNCGVRLTEHFYRLQEGEHITSLPGEVGARWRLVETRGLPLPPAATRSTAIRRGSAFTVSIGSALPAGMQRLPM